MNRRALLLRTGAALMALGGARGVQAMAMPQDHGAPVLAVLRSREGAPASLLGHMTLADLARLPQRELATELPPYFTPGGILTWRGPLLADVLAAHGALSPYAIRVSSLNGYAADIPDTDLRRFTPLLAWQRDGRPMSIRQRGPLILMYPYDQYPELGEDMRYLNRMVWQVDRVVALYR